jgi:hypothetical protein
MVGPWLDGSSPSFLRVNDAGPLRRCEDFLRPLVWEIPALQKTAEVGYDSERWRSPRCQG